jgi:16S rRNA (guanine527-N7)-methyltransferase
MTAMAEDRARALHLLQADADLTRRLDIYVALLARWSAVTNLTSKTTMPHVWSRHVADSGQLRGYAQDARLWLDLGTGAGFPGLVIALQLATVVGAKVHLVESDQRKCAFLREVTRETSAPAQVHAARIQSDEVVGLMQIDAVTARALAPLSQILRFANVWLSRGATGVFPCGRAQDDQILTFLNNPTLKVETFASLVDPRSQIIRVRDAGSGSP